MGLFSLEKRGTLLSSPLYLPGGHQEVRIRPITVVNGGRIRVNRHTWKQERDNFDIRKTVFLMRTVMQ